MAMAMKWGKESEDIKRYCKHISDLMIKPFDN